MRELYGKAREPAHDRPKDNDETRQCMIGSQARYWPLKVMARQNDMTALAQPLNGDLDSAHHHANMHASTSEWLRFAWLRKYHIFTILSCGLRSACRASTYLTREPVGKWLANGGASVPHVQMAEMR